MGKYRHKLLKRKANPSARPGFISFFYKNEQPLRQVKQNRKAVSSKEPRSLKAAAPLEKNGGFFNLAREVYAQERPGEKSFGSKGTRGGQHAPFVEKVVYLSGQTSPS